MNGFVKHLKHIIDASHANMGLMQYVAAVAQVLSAILAVWSGDILSANVTLRDLKADSLAPDQT
ncbi:hypothetical protein DPMN_071139 [Dreissena polymorpha]|uniref:Uncharacterized protein n=1 Tax=Dreissena polymorpha TaxID=45954 RepID=A0A9D4BVI9_DREPO|nr:hypothetical protein DPMN_071139 [Dreissena polymorpha]